MQKQDVVPEIGILMTLWLITVLPVKKAVAVNSQKFIMVMMQFFTRTIQLYTKKQIVKHF